MGGLSRVIAGLLVVVSAWELAGCGGGPMRQSETASSTAAGIGGSVQAWVTTGDQRQLLAPQPALAWQPAASNAATRVIEVDDTQRFQAIAGFGASLTDASAWLIQQRMSPAQREALLRELFGRDDGGLGFSFTRLTIGASDFSRHHYTLNDLPPGEVDPTLRHFSIEPNRADVLPVIQRALAINPQLQVMASPWSAPAWMKTTNSLIKGTLRPEAYDAFARYLALYVEAYAKEGVPIFALTVQNEPHHEPDDYPGMRLDPAQRARFVGQHLGPLLQQRGLKTQLIEWDHNWAEPQSPLAMLADADARRHTAGIGWHCYEGSVDAQAKVRAVHPDKDTWFTECSGGEFNPRWHEYQTWMAKHVLIGATRAWARGVLMWNLALDEKHGPHAGGCKDCRGVVTIDSRTGNVTRNLEYYVLGHASRFVRPGAQRIASSEAVDGLESVAFRNADDGALVLVVCNTTTEARRYVVRQGGRQVEHTLPRESLVTFVWRAG